MNLTQDFNLFAKSQGINSLTLNDYVKHLDNVYMHSGYINPTITEERQLNVAQMDVFSRLMMDRTIFLGTEINDYSANVVLAQLLYLDQTADKKDISIYINSPGGVVYSGLGIYDAMQYVNSDVSTICTGLAASMASVILCAGTPGKRFALPHSRVMIHQPLGGTNGQASDILIAAEEIKTLRDELYTIISNHSGQSIDVVASASDRDHWMTSTQAKEFGMIDDIIKRK